MAALYARSMRVHTSRLLKKVGGSAPRDTGYVICVLTAHDDPGKTAVQELFFYVHFREVGVPVLSHLAMFLVSLVWAKRVVPGDEESKTEQNDSLNMVYRNRKSTDVLLYHSVLSVGNPQLIRMLIAQARVSLPQSSCVPPPPSPPSALTTTVHFVLKRCRRTCKPRRAPNL